MTPRQVWIRRFVELFLEVEVGLRPARHLRPLVHADIFPAVAAAPSQVTSDIVKMRIQVRGDVCEAVVLLRTGSRFGALVVSIRRYDGRWQVTEICRPETPDPVVPAEPADLQFMQPSSMHSVARDPGPEWTMPSGWRQPARAA